MTAFDEVLTRLLADQETDESLGLHGQFGKDRDKVARGAVQKDGEPLEQKPEFFMTFIAVQTLLQLDALCDAESKVVPHIQELKGHRVRISDALARAGEFAERILLNHSDENGFIRMRGMNFHDDQIILSYRHTIGATLVLHLLGRLPDLEAQLVERLCTRDIQRRDGGWPIADKQFTAADILCSAHAAFLLRLALKSGRYDQLQDSIEHRIDSTYAFLRLEAEKSGLWRYGSAVGDAVFTARTYPEILPLLRDKNCALRHRIPKTLATYYPVKDYFQFTPATAGNTGVQNKQQFVIRISYALRAATMTDLPVDEDAELSSEFLEKYVTAREEVLRNYSSERYYETYDLCSALVMHLDSFEDARKSDPTVLWYLSEPILRELPFVGRPFRVAVELYKRLKARKLI